MSLGNKIRPDVSLVVMIVMFCVAFWLGVSFLIAQIPYAIISTPIIWFSRFAMGVYVIWGLGVLLARR